MITKGYDTRGRCPVFVAVREILATDDIKHKLIYAKSGFHGVSLADRLRNGYRKS
jgi:hypothetical protein